jgi:hypothetical protein
MKIEGGSGAPARVIALLPLVTGTQARAAALLNPKFRRPDGDVEAHEKNPFAAWAVLASFRNPDSCRWTHALATYVSRNRC